MRNCTIASIACLLLVLCIPMLATAQSYDHGTTLTDARAVHAMVCGGKTLTPFRPVPSSDPRADGDCWHYSAGDYTSGTECGFAQNSACDNCLRDEQTCVDNAYTACGNADNTEGSCFETKGDDCRRTRDACWSSNHCG